MSLGELIHSFGNGCYQSKIPVEMVWKPVPDCCGHMAENEQTETELKQDRNDAGA